MGKKRKILKMQSDQKKKKKKEAIFNAINPYFFPLKQREKNKILSQKS